jgi:hypothetical protein
MVPALADPPPPDPAGPPPHVALAPDHGGPGTPLTATATGFEACLANIFNREEEPLYAVSFQWDADPPVDPTVSAEDGSRQAADFTVPANAKTGQHKVSALCHGVAHATATFTVDATEKPTLTLDPGKGGPGSPMTASGTGFACGADGVQLFWDGNRPLAEGPSGTFTVGLTVPSDAPTGGHTVVATCRNRRDITVTQSFTVTSNVTPPATESAALVLQPTSGPPGDPVHVTGERFACANRSRTVELSWDDGRQLGSASLDASGHFDTSFSVPANADGRRHTVRAACSDGSAAVATDFTVVAAGTIVPKGPPPPPPPPPSPDGHLWVTALIIAGLVLLGLVYLLSRGRKRPGGPATRVQAVSRPGGPALVTVRETPTPGEATHAIRLQAHTDSGTHTIKEVNDDHRRPE